MCGEGKGRLEREAKALAQVSHPNVITIYEVDVIDDRVVLALEFVSGKTLKQLIGSKNVAGSSSGAALKVPARSSGLLVASARWSPTRASVGRPHRPTTLGRGAGGPGRGAGDPRPVGDGADARHLYDWHQGGRRHAAALGCSAQVRGVRLGETGSTDDGAPLRMSSLAQTAQTHP